VHKKECPIFKRLPHLLPGSVRALTRLLLLQPTLPDAMWAALMGMQHHTTDFRALEHWEIIVNGAKAAHVFSETQLTEPMVLRLYCTVSVLLHHLTAVSHSLIPVDRCS